jgi:hypothetical protein
MMATLRSCPLNAYVILIEIEVLIAIQMKSVEMTNKR